MAKILTAPREDRCIGCGLCVVESSLVKNKKIKISDSYVRVIRDKGKYKISIDYGVDTSDTRVVRVCPRMCLEVEEKIL